MNPLLYGRGTTEGIVAVEPIRDQENKVHVFRRIDGEIQATYETFEPYIYVNEEDPVIGRLHNQDEIEPLLGTNFYNTRIRSSNYNTIKWVKKNTDEHYMPFIQGQWLIHTGNTLFKGMGFDDPLRLYCDIEVLTKEGYEFPNSSRDEDKITIIVMRTNRGDEWSLALNDDNLTNRIDERVIRCEDEKSLLEKWVTMVRKIDPDIMVWHNGFGFDMPYIRDRAALLGVPLQIGRDGSEPHSFMTSIKFAEKGDDYENFKIYGRHMVDTYFLAKAYDVVARKLNGYGLKQCVIHLGKAAEDRVYIDGGDLADAWRNEHYQFNRDDVLLYAFDDVRETQILDQEWGGNLFAQTRMCPLPFQDVSRYGTGNKIDMLFVREYYFADWSLPRPEKRRDFGGGYAGIAEYGFINQRLAYFDVGSMYPTLGQMLNIQPKNDELRLYQPLITALKEARYEAKLGAIEATKNGDMATAKRLKATDGGLKIYLNTGSFGYVGSEWGLFNDYDEAERITTTGRAVTRKMLEYAQVFDCTIVKWDTDGMLVTVPKKYLNKERELANLIEDKVNEWFNKEIL